MKYIIGAGIGGLFGIGAPLMLNTDNIEDSNDSRLEEFQPAENKPPIPIDNALILPDDYCGYITYESTDVKEQAKECLKRSEIDISSLQPIYYVDSVVLKPGDVIIDTDSGDIGLLLHRYDVLEYTPMISSDFGTPDCAIWAWEILWTGRGSDEGNRYQPYTESGVVNMILSGTFEYIPAI